MVDNRIELMLRMVENGNLTRDELLAILDELSGKLFVYSQLFSGVAKIVKDMDDKKEKEQAAPDPQPPSPATTVTVYGCFPLDGGSEKWYGNWYSSNTSIPKPETATKYGIFMPKKKEG